MQIIDAVRDMQLQTRAWRAAGWRIGFVPTMGNLHAGHLRLVQEAQRHADRVVVSIFVNPLQFDEASDFDNYPRTLDADLQHLRQLDVAAVFTPAEQELYPQGRERVTRVNVPLLTEQLEGAHRPGHFAGVATVVTKLFNAVQPDVALFGEKDFQQLLLVHKLVRDLNIPIEVIGVPTIRESDGLAMSSRNGLLTAVQRQQAPELYRVLVWVRQACQAGSPDLGQLEKQAMTRLQQAGFQPEYVSIRDTDTLQPVSAATRQRVVLAAARLGQIRLIDNLQLD